MKILDTFNNISLTVKNGYNSKKNLESYVLDDLYIREKSRKYDYRGELRVNRELFACLKSEDENDFLFVRVSFFRSGIGAHGRRKCLPFFSRDLDLLSQNEKQRKLNIFFAHQTIDLGDGFVNFANDNDIARRIWAIYNRFTNLKNPNRVFRFCFADTLSVLTLEDFNSLNMSFENFGFIKLDGSDYLSDENKYHNNLELLSTYIRSGIEWQLKPQEILAPGVIGTMIDQDSQVVFLNLGHLKHKFKLSTDRPDSNMTLSSLGIPEIVNCNVYVFLSLKNAIGNTVDERFNYLKNQIENGYLEDYIGKIKLLKTKQKAVPIAQVFEPDEFSNFENIIFSNFQPNTHVNISYGRKNQFYFGVNRIEIERVL